MMNVKALKQDPGFPILLLVPVASLLNSLLSPDLPWDRFLQWFGPRVSVFALHRVCKKLDFKRSPIRLLHS